MNYWALALVIVAFTAAICLFVMDLRDRQRELLRMTKLRGSPMYHDMYPLILRSRRRDIDQVRIERDMILFTSVCPPGNMGSFVMENRGYAKLNMSRTKALMAVIAEDIPVLNDHKKYSCRRYRIVRANGEWDYGYVYTIKTPYKDALMRARSMVKI